MRQSKTEMSTKPKRIFLKEHKRHGRIQDLFPGGVQPWNFPGPKLNFRPCQRKKEGITLHFENSRGGPDPPDPPAGSAHVNLVVTTKGTVSILTIGTSTSSI